MNAHVERDRLVAAAQSGDATTLAALLDEHPEALLTRSEPYGWTLLHAAAHAGRLATVDLLLERGLDVNAREPGDNTYPMHWAAADGHLDVVRRLADAGGDVIGSGDDHALEVIGWATCWEPHPAVADFLVSRGARHHIFSAIALNAADEVRRIVAAEPAAINTRMSRNEAHQLPLHFAIRKHRPEMVALLIELGADPLAVDGAGHTAAAYATEPDVDRRVMEAIRAMTEAELVSAERGQREILAGPADLAAALALRDWATAERLAVSDQGALHLMAKRNDLQAARWLLQHGADPNARWSHWDALVTPLHLAAFQGHAAMVRLLLDHGADASLHDSTHDSDPGGWAEFFNHHVAAALLAIDQRDTQRLRPLLHPYLHFDGLRGRSNVLAHLERAGRVEAPASVELRDGQIYRWST